MRLPLIAVLTVSILAAATAAETQWPQFRGPTAQGLSKATGLPTNWSPTDGVKWKAEVPGAGWSSPVLLNDRLYLTSAVAQPGQDTTLHALCLDAKTGRQIWDTEVFKPEPGAVAAMHRKNSPASATPIVTPDRLYVHFGHLGTAALDLQGKILWRQTDLKYTPVHGNGGSPELIGDLLVFSADGPPDPFLAALDAKTGALRWKTPRDKTAKKLFSFSTPLTIQVEGKTQLISQSSGYVAAYDPQNGAVIWRVRYGEGYSVVPRPAYAHGLLFVSSGFDQPTLYAINPTGAQGDVTDTAVVWTQKKGAPLTPSPLIVGDEIYLMADNGILTCADARSGNNHYTQRLQGGFSSSPLFADGKIYVQNETGTGYVLKSGKEFQQLAQNDLGEKTLASYAAADSALYIRTETHLYRMGK
jgi:outer membrane protein assembly factor BamB